MSAITLANSVTPDVIGSAEFRIFQGNSQIARIGVHSGGQAMIPTTSSFTVQATTSMGEFSLQSNTLTFSATSTTLVAEVLTENGYYDFQISQQPGTQATAIVCENTWRNPVKFTLSQPGTPVVVVTVVDEHNDVVISTAQQWTVYAIADGITTGSVTVTNPNATITLVADNNDDSFTLQVS